MPGVPSASGSGIWSRRRDEITFDRLQKFWNDLPPQARQELLKLDKQTLIEQARKNFYCSRCNGLLLESFSQIVIYGKSLQQEASDIGRPRTPTESRITQREQDGAQDPSVHPWGGLSITKDGVLTLLDCFIKAKSLRVLQNVFDNARAREREREMLYPDACGAGGRGWINQGVANYRGHGTREMCALHTAHLSCDTLVDFWSALGEETRSSLLRMKEEDFIEKLMYRFDSKRFCRECRRNVIREFKELKELKRMRREPRCTSWFCVVDNAFQCEVFEDAVVVDWRQCLSEPDGSYHHFEWAIGTDEGESDIFGFEDVGMNTQVHRNGVNLDQFEDYFITLRAWRLDGHYTELCVKAHALKGQSCVHHRLLVGDGFVTMTKGGNFFEHAEEAEEEDEDDAMDRDGNDFDGDGSHPQKHAKSPELAREFLLDAAAVIFKEQVEKAFREGTAQQNAHSVFVSLALKLLEERVHTACKEIITLEKQNKLLEEEEKEKREEQERRMKRRTREREKKLRRKERLKEKENKGKRLVELESPDDVSSSTLSNSSTSTNDDLANTLGSRDSATEEDDSAEVSNLCSPGSRIDQSLCMVINGQNNVHCKAVAEFSPVDSSDLCTSKESKSSKRSPRLREDFAQDQTCWYDESQDGSVRIGDLQWQSRERTSSDRSCNAASTTNNRTRDRHAYNSCSCGHHEDYGVVDDFFSSTARSGREMKMARKSGVEKPRVQYRRCYPLDSFVVSKGTRGSTQKNAIPKQVWEPMDVRKKNNLDNMDDVAESMNADPVKPVDCDTSGCQKVGSECESQPPLAPESSRDVCKSDQSHAITVRSQAAACDGTLTVNKQNCYTGIDEDSRYDEELMTNSAGSDSSSSCMSEGDRESSSSMTSLSAQNPESSSSESEESPDRTKSTVGTPPSRTAPRSLLEACAGNGFREYQPKATRLAHNDRFGFNMSPFQDQLLHHQSMHVPPHSPATMGLHNHSWAAQTNGNFHYARPTPLYSGPLVFGAPGNHFVDYPVQYSSVNPYLAPALSHMHPEPIHKTAASFRTMPPSLPFQNGPQQIAGHAHIDMNLARHPSKLTIPDLPADQNKSGVKDLQEDKSKSQDADASFSLFQFNLPIASPVTPSSKDEKNGELAARPPLVQVQAQVCSREQADVKEYNLFSSKYNGIFSCSNDNDIFSFICR